MHLTVDDSKGFGQNQLKFITMQIHSPKLIETKIQHPGGQMK